MTFPDAFNSKPDAAPSHSPQDASRDILDEAFSALPDALYVFDQDRILSRFNSAAVELQGPGNPPAEGLRCCAMFWRAEDADACIVDRALESKSPVEVEMLAGPNNDLPLLLIVQPIRDHGVSNGAMVIARDISQLRRAEAEALEHKSFLASIADRTPDEIYSLDREGRIIWMNERAERDQLLMLEGRYFHEFIAENCRDLTDDNIKRTLAGDETQFEVRAVRTDGTARHVEAQTSPLWKDGNVSGVLVFLRESRGLLPLHSGLRQLAAGAFAGRRSSGRLPGVSGSGFPG